MELLDDILHDFKNPAIAIHGFATRAKKLLEAGEPEAIRDKLSSYLDIVIREMQRMQDLVLTVSVGGREEVLDLSDIALKRFELNEEAIRESRRTDVEIVPPDLEPALLVYCSRYGLERVLDNLLNNATKAIPPGGGLIALRTYRKGAMAYMELRNSGEIPASHLEEVRRGDVRGRGLNIIYRFVQANHGKIDVSLDSGQTVFTISIPVHESRGPSGGPEAS
jgi:signal transduction histidine kinase